jgi:hypothetical protein
MLLQSSTECSLKWDSRSAASYMLERAAQNIPAMEDHSKLIPLGRELSPACNYLLEDAWKTLLNNRSDRVLTQLHITSAGVSVGEELIGGTSTGHPCKHAV